MMVYKRKESVSILKWALAIVIFVLAMTITVSDVYGLDLTIKKAATMDNLSNPRVNSYRPFVQGSSNPTAVAPNFGNRGFDNFVSDAGVTDYNDPEPNAVPEPSSLILITTGLGSMLLFRRRKMR